MTNEEAAEFLKRFSYKPGYSFSLSSFRNGNPTLLLWQRGVKDANNPTKVIDLVFTSEPVDPREFAMWTEIDLSKFVAFTAKMLEEHEMYEWLKVDSKRLKDPHNQTDVDDLAFNGALSA